MELVGGGVGGLRWSWWGVKLWVGGQGVELGSGSKVYTFNSIIASSTHPAEGVMSLCDYD